MKKFLPVILVVGVIGFVAAGWVIKGKKTPMGPAETTMQTPGSQDESFTGRLKDMVMRGVPLKCSWQQGEYGGEGFIKGQKYYGEMRTPQGQGMVIMKDNCLWSWTKGEKQGLKMCFEPDETETDFWEREEAPTGDYNCSPAIVADAQFELPADVEFLTMDQMMQQFGQ